MTGMQESTENESPEKTRLSARFIQELQRFNGEVWYTYKGTRINLPVNAWRAFGTGSLTVDSAYNFRQLAWVYLSQFNTKDLREALSNTIFHPEAPSYFTKKPETQRMLFHKV